MQIEDLRQIHDSYDHVYLSPHLDDAALSCGGAIARHSNDGARVLVATICTAAPSAQEPLSSFAQQHHQMWGLAPGRAMAARQREDLVALERLDADAYHAGLLDAIYRLPAIYTNNDMLFGTPAPDDPLLYATHQLIAALHGRMPHATFYIPLAIGNHVDHQIIHSAARDSAGIAMAFYEDFPYVTWPGALEQRMAALGQKFIASTINIDATLARKISAIDAYVSQLNSLFDDPSARAQIIADYADRLRPDIGTYGERLWICDSQ